MAAYVPSESDVQDARDALIWHDYYAWGRGYPKPPGDDYTLCGACCGPEDVHPVPNAARLAHGRLAYVVAALLGAHVTAPSTPEDTR